MTKGCSQNDNRYIHLLDSYPDGSQYSEEDSKFTKYNNPSQNTSIAFEPSEYSVKIDSSQNSKDSIKDRAINECSSSLILESSDERICTNLTCNVQRPIEYIPSRKSSRNWRYVKGDSVLNYPSKNYTWNESKSSYRKSDGDTLCNARNCACKNVSTNVDSPPDNNMDSNFPFYNPNALFTVLVNKGTILINPKHDSPIVSVKTGVQRSLPNLSVRQAKVQCSKPKCVDETTSIQQKESLENTVFYSASSASMSDPETKSTFCRKNCKTTCRGKCMCKNLFEGVMSLFSGDTKGGNVMVSSIGTSMENELRGGRKPQSKCIRSQNMKKPTEPRGRCLSNQSGRKDTSSGSENRCMKSCRFQRVCGKHSKHFSKPVCESSIINPSASGHQNKNDCSKQSVSDSRSVVTITSSSTSTDKYSKENSITDFSKKSGNSSVHSNTTQNSLKMNSSNSTLFAKSHYKQLRHLKDELDRIKHESGLYSKSYDSGAKIVRPSSEERSCGGEESEVCRYLKPSRSCRKSSTNATFGGYLATKFIGSNPSDSVELSSDHNYVFQCSNYRKHLKVKNIRNPQHTLCSSQQEYAPKSVRSPYVQKYIRDQEITDTMSTYTSNDVDQPKIEVKSSHKSVLRREKSGNASRKLLRVSSSMVSFNKEEKSLSVENIYDGYYKDTDKPFIILHPPNASKPTPVTNKSNYESNTPNENYNREYSGMRNSKNSMSIPKCSNMVQICKDHSVEQTFGYDPPDIGTQVCTKGKKTGNTSNGSRSAQKVMHYLESMQDQKSISKRNEGYMSKERLEEHNSKYRNSNGCQSIIKMRPTEQGDISKGSHQRNFNSGSSINRLRGERFPDQSILKSRLLEEFPMEEIFRNTSRNELQRVETTNRRIQHPHKPTMERSYQKSILKRPPLNGTRNISPRKLQEISKIVRSPYRFIDKTKQSYNPNYSVENQCDQPKKCFDNSKYHYFPGPIYYKDPMSRSTCTPTSYSESGYNSVGEKSYYSPSKTYLYSDHSYEEGNGCTVEEMYSDNLEETYGEEVEYSEYTGDYDSYPEN